MLLAKPSQTEAPEPLQLSGAGRGRATRRVPSWRRRWARLAGTLLVLAFLLAPRVARAETWGQYLVIIDDSGSMNQSDPNRLVMLASLSLAAALGDSDQVMIAGLNELAKGEVSGARFVSPRELLAQRDGPEGARSLAGPRFETMARHQGGTPCKQALARAASILEEVASAGAPQTLLLLTDGACTGGVVPAADWLAGLRSHDEGRFRFALLTKKQAGKQGGERLDPALVEYATATGWSADPVVPFDARSLLRAFAEVLSFSRGLRFEDGAGVQVGRSFAGARELRVLAVSTDGQAPIHLALTDASMDSRAEALGSGPTFEHDEYPWSLRVARTDARQLPFSVHSSDAGVEVLAIPSYGELRVEAVVGPCEGNARPALPWTRERAVRSGQPACAWARLVGDSGQTIHPAHSLSFEMELCEDEAATTCSAMQPDADGTFNAQLGVMPEGRSERWFRAQGSSLAAPVVTRRGIQALAFGITSVARADQPDTPIDNLELGVLPQALPTVVTLEYAGSFPDGSEATVACEVTGDAGHDDLLAGELACLRCVPKPSTVALQDPFTVQVELQASSFCPMISAGLGELPVALDLIVAGSGDVAAIERRVPISATLRHAVVEPQTAEVTGGEDGRATLSFPAPVNATVELELEAEGEGSGGASDDLDDLTVALAQTQLRLTGEPGETAQVELELEAADCCSAGDYAFVLHVRDAAGGPSLAVPVTVTVAKPSFWVCPGKTILKWTLAILAVLSSIWLVRGFTSPAKFAETAVLARAESHEALAKLGEGDEDWRLVRSLEPTKRGFYKPATIHLGGSKAALPSLRDLPDDARIEARSHGNATLVVDAEGIETFKESTGWEPVPVGERPIGSSLVLRRDDTYLMFRR